MTSNHYDYIVVGLGAFGLSTLKELASKKYKVLGIDTGRPGGDNSLSFGETRIFRSLYSEDESFIPLTIEAKAIWERYFKVENSPLSITYDDSHIKTLEKAISCAKKNRIDIEVHGQTLTEKESFLIDVQAYFKNVLKEIDPTRATIETQNRLISYERKGQDLKIMTQKGEFSCNKLILSSGAHLNTLAKKKLPLIYERSPVLWYDSPLKDPKAFYQEAGYFFIVPSLDRSQVKVFNYFPTKTFSSLIEFESHRDKKEFSTIKKFAKERGLENPINEKIGMYHTTSNEHFILEYLDDEKKVFIASGGSGHAFKFAPILGRLVLEKLLT